MSAARVVPIREAVAPSAGAPRLIGLDTSPLHGELLGVERLEERARALAAGFTLARNPRRGPPRLLRRLAEHARTLRLTYRELAADVRAGRTIPAAAEWLLDNFHLVEGEMREIRRDLPSRYYRELPKLAAREHSRTARRRRRSRPSPRVCTSRSSTSCSSACAGRARGPAGCAASSRNGSRTQA